LIKLKSCRWLSKCHFFFYDLVEGKKFKMPQDKKETTTATTPITAATTPTTTSTPFLFES